MLVTGAYGNAHDEFSDVEEVPVWAPVQGGVVAGLVLMATGVPRDADWLSISLVDAGAGTRPVGRYTTSTAYFLCNEDEAIRIWDRGMISIEDRAYNDIYELQGREVAIEVEARFPDPYTGESIAVENESTAVLVVIEPARHPANIDRRLFDPD